MEIEVSRIKDAAPKRDHGNIDDLKNSIREVGLINPITVNQEFRLLAGRRRFQAITELGWKKVPVRVVNSAGELFDFRVALIENIARKNLSEPEEAAAIKEYDELKRKLEGEKPRGRRWDNSPQRSELESGWTQDKTAADLGISRQAVGKAIQIAEAVEERPERLKLKTGTAILRDVRREYLKKKVSALPCNKYRVIYADPPWKYGSDSLDGYGIAEHHYPTMSIDDLCSLDVKALADDNAVLFMWVTSPILAECWPVIRAWGFEYKSSFVWDKVRHNFGNYNSVRHEFLLICVRGSCTPDISKKFDSVVSVERTEHSKKPEIFREMIMSLYPSGKRVELFARESRDGWETWGNEV